MKNHFGQEDQVRVEKNYNGGNLENKGNNGATMNSIHEYFANGQDNSATNLAKET